MASSSDTQAQVIVWTKNLFDSEPVWPRDPDSSVISTIARRHLRIPAGSSISVTFSTEGAFNKLYTIESPYISNYYIFRVTLPVESFYKTASEVATLLYLRRHTSIPIAEVVAYSATSDNELGFEWILMEGLTGVCLRDIWPRFPGDKELEKTGGSQSAPIPWEQKEEISRTVARYLLQLRNISFTSIGSLYLRSDIKENAITDTEDPQFIIGPLVSLNFFYGGLRSRVPRDRGPYTNEHRYAGAFIDVVLHELELAQQLDPDDPQYDDDLMDDGPEILQGIKMLQSVLDIIFSREPDKSGYTLHHHDLSLANILVDPKSFQITGIVDWECVGVVPRWEDTHPQFLEAPEVELELESLEVGDVDPLRMERWENWEKMRLRKVFDAGIQEKDRLKREFMLHLNSIHVWSRKAIKWAEEVKHLQLIKSGENYLQSTYS